MRAVLPHALVLSLISTAGCGGGSKPLPPLGDASVSADSPDARAADAANDVSADVAPSDVGFACGAFESLLSAADLPVGACMGQTQCAIQTQDFCPGTSSPGPNETWRCDCLASGWSCALVSMSKVACASSSCPDIQPMNGVDCSQPGLLCTWGSAPCLSRGVCKSHRWAVTTPSCILP